MPRGPRCPGCGKLPDLCECAVAPAKITKYVNPKDKIGCKKPSLWVIPDTALLHLGQAMSNGASKYGPYNWRDQPIHASIYTDAMMRHLIMWRAGEDYAEDSGVHHLGHLLATAAIALDAQEQGTLVDDRPKNERIIKLMEELTKKIA